MTTMPLAQAVTLVAPSRMFATFAADGAMTGAFAFGEDGFTYRHVSEVSDEGALRQAWQSCTVADVVHAERALLTDAALRDLWAQAVVARRRNADALARLADRPTARTDLHRQLGQHVAAMLGTPGGSVQHCVNAVAYVSITSEQHTIVVAKLAGGGREHLRAAVVNGLRALDVCCRVPLAELDPPVAAAADLVRDLATALATSERDRLFGVGVETGRFICDVLSGALPTGAGERSGGVQ